MYIYVLFRRHICWFRRAQCPLVRDEVALEGLGLGNNHLFIPLFRTIGTPRPHCPDDRLAMSVQCHLHLHL